MSKFIIECQHCGTYHEASISFFAKRKIDCSCGTIIDVRKDKFRIKKCMNCGNTVMYDQTKGTNALCPVCKEQLITKDSYHKFIDLNCPSCKSILHLEKDMVEYECPLCNEILDVQKEISKKELKDSGEPNLIKYEGTTDLLVWKHPIEDFNLGSQLIVSESQEAIFLKDGKALEVFSPGRYLLAKEKLPKLDDLFKLTVNDENVIHTEVYFINKIIQTNIKWGTDSKVKMFDPNSGLHVELGAYGEFSLEVKDSKLFLIKLIGTARDISTYNYDAKSIIGKFKALIITKVKSILSRVIKNNNINVLEIDEHIEDISLGLKDEINHSLEEYGLYLPDFYVMNIITPDDDPNFRKMKEQYAEQYLLTKDEQIKKNVALAAQQRKIIEAQTAAQEEIILAQAKAEAYRLKAQAEAQEMQMKGYTYNDETKRQVSVAVASNGNHVLNDLVGVGVTLGTMESVADVTKNIVNNTFANNLNTTWDCECGQKGNTTNFCPNCGSKKPQTTWDCECGQKDNTTNFCPNCGKKR